LFRGVGAGNPGKDAKGNFPVVFCYIVCQSQILVSLSLPVILRILVFVHQSYKNIFLFTQNIAHSKVM
jgi:hypothetical protein